MPELKIFIDAIKDHKEVCFDETLPSSFIGIDEKELKTNFEIHLKAKGYLSGDCLVINFSLKTKFAMPCLICNNLVEKELLIDNEYLTIEREMIKNKIYDFKNDIRQAIILKYPKYIECNDNCKERENIKKYLKDEKDNNQNIDNKYYPFDSLN